MAHSFTSLKYHIVFGTKYRLPLIKERFERELYSYIGGIEDHVHILAGFHQSRSVAAMAGAIKSSSSSFGKRNSDDRTFGWQMGYAAFTVSESQAARVKRYIQRQKEHHRTLSFEDEMRTLFRGHGVQFDEAFFKGEPDDR